MWINSPLIAPYKLLVIKRGYIRVIVSCTVYRSVVKGDGMVLCAFEAD